MHVELIAPGGNNLPEMQEELVDPDCFRLLVVSGGSGAPGMQVKLVVPMVVGLFDLGINSPSGL